MEMQWKPLESTPDWRESEVSQRSRHVELRGEPKGSKPAHRELAVEMR